MATITIDSNELKTLITDAVAAATKKPTSPRRPVHGCEIATSIAEYMNLFSEAATSAFMATPADIKNKWFADNRNVDTITLRKILKYDFKLPTPEKVVRYNPFGNPTFESRPGRPFIFASKLK